MQAKKGKQDCFKVLTPAYQWLRPLLFLYVGDGGNLWQRSSNKQLVMVTFKTVPVRSARFNLIISCNRGKKTPTNYLNLPSLMHSLIWGDSPFGDLWDIRDMTFWRAQYLTYSCWRQQELTTHTTVWNLNTLSQIKEGMETHKWLSHF